MAIYSRKAKKLFCWYWFYKNKFTLTRNKKIKKLGRKFFAQIILSEVLPQTTKQEWRVCVVNALIHRIGKMFQMKIFQSNILAKCSKYWFDDVHLSDEGLKLFMNKLENFANKLVLEGLPGSFSLNRNNFGGEGKKIFFSFTNIEN